MFTFIIGTVQRGYFGLPVVKDLEGRMVSLHPPEEHMTMVSLGHTSKVSDQSPNSELDHYVHQTYF